MRSGPDFASISRSKQPHVAAKAYTPAAREAKMSLGWSPTETIDRDGLSPTRRMASRIGSGCGFLRTVS
jgi:hypothetical protein